MRRFIPSLGIAAGLVFYVFVVAVADEFSRLAPVANVGAEPTVLSLAPAVSIPPPADEPSAEKMQDKPAQPRPKAPPTATPASAPVPAPPPVVDEAGLNAAATTLRAALVNIICYAPAGSPIHSISGSGVFVDPKGIILTNAHIAQYLLLAGRDVSCTIRAGGPATDKYKAELIYIPTAWLQANSTVLTQTDPSGTGEYDFAFLAVSKSAGGGASGGSALPSSFPSIPLATEPPNAGAPVVIATYAAQFLESSQIQSALFPTIVFGSVKDVFTFKTNTVDVLALGGSAAAQEGSSGGGVANSDERLVGVITTSTTKGTTDTRALDAITASYIRAAYASETGNPLDLLLSQPTAASIADFAEKTPALAAIITAQLP